MQANPYQKFMQQTVSTMTPAQMLVALYDKAEQELKKAIYFIENKEIENASKAIVKVQNIVATLDGSLKVNYDISNNLSALYGFIMEKLVQANIKKDTAIIHEILPFFAELKETFTEIMKKGN